MCVDALSYLVLPTCVYPDGYFRWYEVIVRFRGFSQASATMVAQIRARPLSKCFSIHSTLWAHSLNNLKEFMNKG
jgi:hypothetical protein